MAKQIIVGIADMKMARQEGVLITYALGSCIGIALYDPMIKLGTLVHIMLPELGTMADEWKITLTIAVVFEAYTAFRLPAAKE